MSAAQDRLDTEIRQSWPGDDASRTPDFASTWRAAEARHYRTRRRQRRLAGAAAVVAVVLAGVYLQWSPPDPAAYVEIDDLMGSTSWEAPSDVLLPQHQFDIYQELPALIESTELAGGALL